MAWINVSMNILIGLKQCNYKDKLNYTMNILDFRDIDWKRMPMPGLGYRYSKKKQTMIHLDVSNNKSYTVKQIGVE